MMVGGDVVDRNEIDVMEDVIDKVVTDIGSFRCVIGCS